MKSTTKNQAVKMEQPLVYRKKCWSKSRVTYMFFIDIAAAISMSLVCFLG